MKQAKESWIPKLPPQCELSVEDGPCVGQELSEFTQLFGDTFRRTEAMELCELYLQGLLSNTERKNVEAMALQLDGPERVRHLQRFVSDYRWDESWLRQRQWELCAESLSDEQGVWSIDASELAKKGEASVGVAPQYCGALGPHSLERRTTAPCCESAALFSLVEAAPFQTAPSSRLETVSVA